MSCVRVSVCVRLPNAQYLRVDAEAPQDDLPHHGRPDLVEAGGAGGQALVWWYGHDRGVNSTRASVSCSGWVGGGIVAGRRHRQTDGLTFPHPHRFAALSSFVLNNNNKHTEN